MSMAVILPKSNGNRTPQNETVLFVLPQAYAHRSRLDPTSCLRHFTLSFSASPSFDKKTSSLADGCPNWVSGLQEGGSRGSPPPRLPVGVHPNGMEQFPHILQGACRSG
jgi:hypothetical protein